MASPAMSDMRDALGAAVDGMDFSLPAGGAKVLTYAYDDLAEPTYDEQKESRLWVQHLIEPTESGEVQMGCVQQMCDLRFVIGSPKDMGRERAGVADALVERFTASNLGGLVVEFPRERDDDAAEDGRQWHRTTLTFDAWYDIER